MLFSAVDLESVSVLECRGVMLGAKEGYLGETVWGRHPPHPTFASAPHSQVRSPLSDSILGEQALAVTDDKVSVLELRVQPVMGIALSLSRGASHPGEVTAMCWAQSSLPAPKQVMAGGEGAWSAAIDGG